MQTEFVTCLCLLINYLRGHQLILILALNISFLRCYFVTDQSYEFKAPFALGSLFHTTLSKFARYNGSLTTPGCLETVLWTVFEETIKMSADQVSGLMQKEISI